MSCTRTYMPIVSMYVHFVVCNADEGGLDISSSSAAGRNAWPVSQHVSLCTKLVIVILALCRTWFAHYKTLAWLVGIPWVYQVQAYQPKWRYPQPQWGSRPTFSKASCIISLDWSSLRCHSISSSSKMRFFSDEALCAALARASLLNQPTSSCIQHLGAQLPTGLGK